jgi:hypothetical protein
VHPGQRQLRSPSDICASAAVTWALPHIVQNGKFDLRLTRGVPRRARIRVYFRLYGRQEEFLVVPACRDEQRLIRSDCSMDVASDGRCACSLRAHRLAEIFANVEAFEDRIYRM